VPALIAARGRHAGQRFVEFFDWCDQAGFGLLDIEPVHVAVWVEELGRRFAPPTVKQ
jgi:hypothetical protein